MTEILIQIKNKSNQLTEISEPINGVSLSELLTTLKNVKEKSNSVLSEFVEFDKLNKTTEEANYISEGESSDNSTSDKELDLSSKGKKLKES